MILLSVGTQLPFDRLTRAVDQWAAACGRTDVIAQIGPSRYRPTHMQSFAFVEHEEFRELQRRCTLMISHAGMGSIITAMEFGKPIIIMARDHRCGEHRNGHQLATLHQFSTRAGIYAARDAQELVALLEHPNELTAVPTLGRSAPNEMVAQLATYVRGAGRLPVMRRLRNLLS